MAGSPTTILIPDISGFTEFITKTELSHGSFAISMLINTIIEAVKEQYEISEIEGDAVLMFKKGPAPSQKDIKDTCLKIFNAFHFRRQWMQQHAVCPCKACTEITHLTLKFVAHHGSLGEIKAGGFTKLSGPDVIVAHRLLKNGVPSNEYLLLTEKLLQHTSTDSDPDMEWSFSSEEYPSIGKVDYRFALLQGQRINMPDLPSLSIANHQVFVEFEISIASSYKDAYMVLMNIPERPEWLPSLQNVEQDVPTVFIGSIHYCTFSNYQAIASPMQMTITENEIVYIESCRMDEKALSVVYEFHFKKLTETTCMVHCQLLNAGDLPIAEKEKTLLSENVREIVKNLKTYCENHEPAFFV